MVIHQGSIFYFQFSPSQSHEQEKRRPAIILSNDLVAKYSGMYIVAPISFTKRQFPMYYTLKSTHKVYGKVLLDQTKALDFKARHITNQDIIEQVNKREMKNINYIYKLLFDVEQKRFDL